MHCSRMRTARSLTVSHCIQKNWKNHAHPPRATMHASPWEQPCMPPQATMHAPPATMHTPPEQPCMPPQSNHACPPWKQPCMPPWSNHARPPPEQPRMPPLEQPRMPPQEQPRMPPPLWTEWQTGVKILPCPKLRLRAVKTWNLNCCIQEPSFYEVLTWPPGPWICYCGWFRLWATIPTFVLLSLPGNLSVFSTLSTKCFMF